MLQTDVQIKVLSSYPGENENALVGLEMLCHHFFEQPEVRGGEIWLISFVPLCGKSALPLTVFQPHIVKTPVIATRSISDQFLIDEMSIVSPID